MGAQRVLGRVVSGEVTSECFLDFCQLGLVPCPKSHFLSGFLISHVETHGSETNLPPWGPGEKSWKYLKSVWASSWAEEPKFPASQVFTLPCHLPAELGAGRPA